MSRIAILADIHGNVPALEAALEDLREQAVDEVLLGGDLVGRGPQGGAVVEIARSRGWACVRGNHEEYLLDFRMRNVPDEWQTGEQWSASRWMSAELSDRDVDHIRALPFRLRPRTAPEVLLVHGSPNSVNEGIGPWTCAEQLDAHLECAGGRVLVCAHTHRANSWKRPGGLIVNAGAVGLPFNRDRRAQYVILERSADGTWEVDFRRVDYDLEKIFRVYETSGFLREGQVTARLLRMELEHAAPFLVPFIQWADAVRRPVAGDQIPRFLEFYDPDESMSTFHSRLEAST